MSETPPGPRPRVLVALGGNALIRPGDEGTVEQQFETAREVATWLAPLARQAQLIVTHGNGPQVGRILLRADLCLDEVPGVPIDMAVASTQGEIGMMLQQALEDELGGPVYTVLTRVQVEVDDPDFADPSKFVGRFYLEAEARTRALTLGWQVKEDPGRGWRRVVPSPRPTHVLEVPAIEALLRTGATVIACGGGGVPMIRQHGRLVSVEAVVDKDRASSLLARLLNVDAFIILTGVSEVMVDFGTPQARALGAVSAEALRRHLEQGQFPPGSMGPKVEAALDYIDGGGREVMITAPESLEQALLGKSGTRVRADAYSGRGSRERT